MRYGSEDETMTKDERIRLMAAAYAAVNGGRRAMLHFVAIARCRALANGEGETGARLAELSVYYKGA